MSVTSLFDDLWLFATYYSVPNLVISVVSNLVITADMMLTAGSEGGGIPPGTLATDAVTKSAVM